MSLVVYAGFGSPRASWPAAGPTCSALRGYRWTGALWRPTRGCRWVAAARTWPSATPWTASSSRWTGCCCRARNCLGPRQRSGPTPAAPSRGTPRRTRQALPMTYHACCSPPTGCVAPTSAVQRDAAPVARRPHSAWANSTSVPVSEFGYVMSSSRGPITTDAFRLIRDWCTQSEMLQVPTLPLVVVEDRLAVSGETALRRLEKELQRVGARIDPGLPDPGRYPAVSDRPASSWVSQNGGRWRHSWRASA
jgi:hypothetical protein